MNLLYLELQNGDTHIDLPLTLDLKNKGVALMEIAGFYTPRQSDKHLYLCCDFIQSSVLQGGSRINLHPILHHVTFKSGKKRDGSDALTDKIAESYSKLIFLPCNRDDVSDIRLYLVDDQGNSPSFKECHLKCTLLITSQKKYGART